MAEASLTPCGAKPDMCVTQVYLVHGDYGYILTGLTPRRAGGRVCAGL